MNLKPGDLVLVKANVFKGKRKIRDRLEEETCEVVCQIATDVPSYEVMDQCRWSCFLHKNWLLLIASEVGIALCIGVHHAWDRCTRPTPCNPTSKGSEDMMMPQENSGLVASKTSLGWINEKSQHLQWMSTRSSTEDGWWFQVMCSGCRCWKEHICLAKGITSLPINAIGWWTPWLTQVLTELGKFARHKMVGVTGKYPSMSGG